MKLKTAGILTVAFGMMISANANANLLIDPYVGLTVGAGGAAFFADGDDETMSAQSYGAVLGLDIPFIRIEGEYNYLRGKESKMQIAMGNVYFKIPSVVVHPYIGGGVGTIFDGDAYDIKIKSTMAYQAMIGVTFDIPALPIDIDAEARALYAPDIYDINDIEPDTMHYDLRLKLRYVF